MGHLYKADPFFLHRLCLLYKDSTVNKSQAAWLNPLSPALQIGLNVRFDISFVMVCMCIFPTENFIGIKKILTGGKNCKSLEALCRIS